MYDKNLYDINTENELFNSVRISKPAGNYVCDTCGGEIVKGTGYVYGTRYTVFNDVDVIYSNTKMCIHCAIKDKVIVPVGLNKPNATESVYLPVADVLSDREKLNLHWDKVLTEKQWYSKNGNVTPFAAMSDLHKTYTIQKLLDMNNETCDRIALELTGLLNISIANKIIKHTQGENN